MDDDVLLTIGAFARAVDLVQVHLLIAERAAGIGRR